MSDADLIIVKHNFNEFKVDNYPKLSDDEAFERFVIDLLLRRYGAGPADIEQGLMSSKDDGGIDGFYIFLNNSEYVGPNSPRLGSRRTALNSLQKTCHLMS